MRDEKGTDVRVIVTDLALDAIDPAKLSSDAFHAYRAEVERLASAKHAAGNIEKDGTVKVTSADVYEAKKE